MIAWTSTDRGVWNISIDFSALTGKGSVLKKVVFLVRGRLLVGLMGSGDLS